MNTYELMVILNPQVSDAEVNETVEKTKKILADEIIEFLRPVREHRRKFANDRAYMDEVLKKGASHARMIAAQTIEEVRKAVFQ